MLTDRIQALVSDLEAAESAVNSKRILPFVQSEASQEFTSALRREADALRTLERDAVRGSLAPQTCWQSFEAHRLDCSKLLRSCLAFVQGASIRALELDAGICLIGDALIEDLSSRSEDWKEFTLIAEDESYADLSAIIHLRFPARDIWTLPIAAHEFGHYLAGELVGRDAARKKVLVFDAFREEARLDAEAASRSWSRTDDRRLEEFFADSVGVFALGPCFACACLLLRFSPFRDTAADGATHPSDVERAFVIRRTLSLLADESGGDYKGVVTRVEKEWAQSLADIGLTDVSGARAKELGRLAKSLFRLLQESASKMRFARWTEAATLWSDIKKSPELGERADDVSIADLLNAAWIGRLRADPDWPIDRINVTVLGIARHIGASRRPNLKRGIDDE